MWFESSGVEWGQAGLRPWTGSREFIIATDRLALIRDHLNMDDHDDTEGRSFMGALLMVGGECWFVFVCSWIQTKEGARLIALIPFGHDSAGDRSCLSEISTDKHVRMGENTQELA